MDNIKLTQFSHGAGCGCKISPKVLSEILGDRVTNIPDPRLLVGNSNSDDAAVYDIGDGQTIISTTDFFMPIVDDPVDFGAIASVNALSDVYAMGGEPIMAIAILGWPIDKIPANFASQVLEGARSACQKAGITLAGGHSIDCPEPIFGLAVTGKAPRVHIKENSNAQVGSHLFLTKSIGVGIVTTAQKKGVVNPKHFEEVRRSMLNLNQIGAELGKKEYVNCMTDVTGFGLLGHLNEICEASGLSATVESYKVPKFDFLDTYIDQKCIPGGTHRNWDSYGHLVSMHRETEKLVLADPQTSGGLIVSVSEDSVDTFHKDMEALGYPLNSFGRLVPKTDHNIVVEA